MNVSAKIDLGAISEKSNDKNIDFVLQIAWVCVIYYKAHNVIDLVTRQRFNITESSIDSTDKDIEKLIDDSWIFFSAAFEDIRKHLPTLFLLEGINDESKILYSKRIKDAFHSLS